MLMCVRNLAAALVPLAVYDRWLGLVVLRCTELS
jgi:hypothetical protein